MDFTFKEQLKSFCDKYKINILDSNRRTPKLTKNEYFNDPLDKSVITTISVIETEPLVTLEIPLSKLELMAKIEATYFNHEYSSGFRTLFEAMLDSAAQEKAIRDEVPAVAEAYSAYSTLLHLCKYSKK